MPSNCKVEEFIRDLQALKSTSAFNPYTGRCQVSDDEHSCEVRTNNLRLTLQKAVTSELDSVWLGRDLGYRGGRRTGLALTDEHHLEGHGARWGIATQKATVDDVIGEQTAGAVWEMLNLVKCHVFAWNVYPLHPHPPDRVFANRAHTSAERRVGEQIMDRLLALTQPRRIIAIGNDAGKTAHRLCGESIKVSVVRHPSYGGRVKFRSALLELYGIQERLWS